MRVLGVNAVFHDPAAALLVDGEIVAAAEEEHFSRRKHGKRPVPFSTWELPVAATEWCLEEGGLAPSDLDAIGYSYDPELAPSANGDLIASEWEAALEEDPAYRRFKEAARRAGVAGRVRFLGAVGHEEVPALLRSADVVACVPWYEPFGMVAVEALACGVPVLATAVGGLVDTVVDRVTGLHVPPRDPPAIARGLRTLLDRPDLREAMGGAGAARARAHYGWPQVARATKEVYERVVSAPAARREEAGA